MKRESWCIWITGLPGCGKSTISRVLLDKLKNLGINAQIISSDMLRKVITPTPTYSLKERDMVYSAIVLLAKLLTQNEINVIIDATGNLRQYRNHARNEIKHFMEAYVRCPLGTAIQREKERKEYAHAPSSIYKKALNQESQTVPGIGAPYEQPEKPEVVVDSDKLDPEQSAQKILEALVEAFR